MAEANIKTIRAELKELIETAKVQGKINKENKIAVDNARARLKAVRNLNKEEQSYLKDTFKETKNQALLLKYATAKSKTFQDIGKTLEKQMQTNMKIVKGEMSTFDKVKMTFDLRKQTVAINNISKQIAEAKLKGLEGEVTALENAQKVLKDNQKLQMQHLNLSKDTNDVEQDMKDKLDETFPALGKITGAAKKFTGAMLANPMAAIAIAALALVALMAKLVKSGMELQKELGLSVQETFKLQATLMAASFEMSGLGISAADVKETAMALVNEFGSFENVTKDTLVTMSKMNTEFGIAGSTSAALLGVMESVSGESRAALMSQMESTAELARAAGVAPGQIMADVASDTEFFSKYAKDGGANVMEAAIQAKKLGLNMSTVSAMADSLLDFESSIESQMEASMMLGRSINTDVARRLALEGDLVGMQKEVMKQVGNEAEFNAMNTLQRQALAKAFGLSVTDLGKMVRDQEVLNNMTAEERAARDAQAAALEKSKKHMTDFLARVKEIGLMLFTTLLPAFKLIGAAVVLISIVLKPFIEGVRIILPILLAMGAALGVMALIFVIMNAQLVITSILSWLAAAPWYAIPLLIIGIIGLVSVLLKKFGVFKMLNEYLVKPIKEAWARFVEFVGGMETIKKVLKVIFMVMFAPVLAIPLLIWGVIKAFKMLVDKMGGFKSMMVKIFKAAFWPFFLWWDLVQKAKNFIGSFFGGGGGGKAPAAASPAVSMAAGGVVTKPTTATLGDAGPEAAVPLGNKFDLSETNSKFDVLIAQNKMLMDKLTKKVTELGVAG